MPRQVGPSKEIEEQQIEGDEDDMRIQPSVGPDRRATITYLQTLCAKLLARRPFFEAQMCVRLKGPGGYCPSGDMGRMRESCST